MKSVIYARVSSVGDRQSTRRQVLDLTEHSNKNGYELQKVFEEHISGAKKNRERAVLTECLEYCVKNRIDILLCSELSRIGRNVDEVLASIRFCKENRINIYLQKENISIYDAEGKENPFLTIMVAVLGTCASLERENIKFRLESGRKRYVEKNLREIGKTGLGRKPGYRKTKEMKMMEYAEVLKLLKKPYPIRKIAILTGVGISTIQRLKNEFAL